MSRNSSGTYTLPTGNPVVSGTVIEANWANSTLDDISAALTDSLSRSGKGSMSAALRIIDGSVSVPGVAFANETGSGAYRSAAGDWYLTVLGAGIARLRASGLDVTGAIGSSGNMTVGGTLGVTGATTLSSTLAVTGDTTLNGQTLTLTNSTAYYPQILNRNTTNDANGSYILVQKKRGSSIVQNGDTLGNFVFQGYDGTQYLQGAYMNAVVSAAPGANDMPTDLAFGTTPDGSAGPSERMRLDKSGNLGLGVTPSAWDQFKALQLGGATYNAISTSNDYLLLGANAYYDNTGNFKYVSSTGASWYTQSGGSHYWVSASSGTAGTNISTTQVLSVGKNQTLALQGATIQPGTGITFPASQSASSNANTLDDYEEGTWTPTLPNGGTITTNTYAGVAYYTKVGRVVTISFGNCSISGTPNNSNFIQVGGLPFAPAAGEKGCGSFGFLNNASTLFQGFSTDGSLLLFGARRGDYIVRNSDIYNGSVFFTATVTYTTST